MAEHKFRVEQRVTLAINVINRSAAGGSYVVTKHCPTAKVSSNIGLRAPPNLMSELPGRASLLPNSSHLSAPNFRDMTRLISKKHETVSLIPPMASTSASRCRHRFVRSSRVRADQDHWRSVLPPHADYTNQSDSRPDPSGRRHQLRAPSEAPTLHACPRFHDGRRRDAGMATLE